MFIAAVVRRPAFRSFRAAGACLPILLTAASALAGPAVGVISTMAGTGVAGYNGDFTVATSAQLRAPFGVAVDSSGNVYIADTSNHRVRKVAAGTGVITTVAGTGTQGFLGDGGAATAARLNDPYGVAVDSAGNLYIADTENYRIRMVAAGTGVITTVAGSGGGGFGGDNGAATAALLNRPYAVVVDAGGNLFIADTYNHRIRRVQAGSGIISTLAGTGVTGYNGDGPGTAVNLYYPTGVAVDAGGTVYIADQTHQRIRRLASGLISTVVGTGSATYGGENGPGAAALVRNPFSVAVDAVGNVYIGDLGNDRVRKLTVATGLISTVAGSGTATFGGDGGEATAAQLNNPAGVAVDGSGTLYIADNANNRIRKVSPPTATRAITTIAGTGDAGYNGDGPAVGARLYYPTGVAVDAVGNVYISDQSNNRIRRVAAATGIISTVAGGGTAPGIGENGPAINARLNSPAGIALDTAGNLYIADVNNQRVRKVNAATGIITTIAGSGVAGYLGDGGLATAAQLNDPYGVAVDAFGNVFIADEHNDRVRKVAANGIITTVAGTGIGGVGGDGGLATAAQLNDPTGVAVDGAGNLYIADYLNHRIRRVTAVTGLISTFAGTGQQDYSGEAGPATLARLNNPIGVAVDAAGNVYIADTDNDRARMVAAGTGIITTIAGTGYRGYYGGEGGAATAGSLNRPYAVAVDTGGNVYVADTYNHRARKAAVPVGESIRLTVRVLNGTSTRLTWTPAAGASSYTIRRITTSGVESVLATGFGGTTFVDNGVTPRTTYRYVVTADLLLSDNVADVWVTPAGVTGDLDADGRTDITVFRPTTGQWFVRYSSQAYGAGGASAFTWGLPGDLPIAGDVDGDHQADLTVYRPSTGQWVIGYSSQGYNPATPGVYQWGALGDVPIGSDFDGDGKLDLGVYRPTTGQWFIRYSAQDYSLGSYGTYQWGAPGDAPLAADFDGDGKTDVAVYRPATGQWLIRYSSQGYDAATPGVYQWGALGDQPLVADFDGDGTTDLTVFRPLTSEWLTRYSTSGYGVAGVFQWGQHGDTPLVLDLDGDGKTELTVVRPSTGDWLSRYSTSSYAGIGSLQWGLAGDIPLPRTSWDPVTHAGDFEGDGKADLAVYRPSTGIWYLSGSQNGFSPAKSLAIQWGLSGDEPVSRDFDGDRLADLAVYRPSTGEWFVRYSSRNYSATAYDYFQWGLPGDVPLGADLDGDGRAEVIVYRPSTGQWYVRYSTQGYSVATYGLFQWGLPGDAPIVGDFDGDGRSELTVYRPSSGQWFILYSGQGFSVATYGLYQFGAAGDRPLTGDFDGDRKADLAIYRPATGQWLTRHSSQGYSAATGGVYQWGLGTDIPLVRDFDGDGRAELTLYRPSSGQWLVRYSSQGFGGASGVYQWGLAADIAVPR